MKQLFQIVLLSMSLMVSAVGFAADDEDQSSEGQSKSAWESLKEQAASATEVVREAGREMFDYQNSDHRRAGDTSDSGE